MAMVASGLGSNEMSVSYKTHQRLVESNHVTLILKYNLHSGHVQPGSIPRLSRIGYQLAIHRLNGGD